MLGESARTTATALVLLTLAFVPLEALFPARPRQRPWRRGAVVDLLFFLGQYFVWSALALWVLTGVHGTAGRAFSLPSREMLRTLPFWAQASVVLVLGEVLVYWLHRAFHAVGFLWRFHAVHHSAERLDWLAAHREHPVDGILVQLAMNLPGMLLGFPLDALASVAAFRGLWAILIHSNVRLPLGPVGWLLGDPALHHWHHARLERTSDNFANLAPWLDRLFGTYHRPPGEERYPLGVAGLEGRGYLFLLLHPFRPSHRLEPRGAQPGATSSPRAVPGGRALPPGARC